MHSSNESQGGLPCSFSSSPVPEGKKHCKERREAEASPLMPSQGCGQPFHIPIQSSRDNGPVQSRASEAAPLNNRDHGQDRNPAGRDASLSGDSRLVT